MPKQILLVRFSQTGQTNAVSQALITPLQQAGYGVDVLDLLPTQAFPFPWPFFQFLDIFPETVAGTARYSEAALAAMQPAQAHYDLVILTYPVWFLSPVPPMQAFLRSPLAAKLLRNTPVITLTTCRNMWMQAQMVMRDLLDNIGARLLDHVAITDPSPALATFITTPYWVLTGKKTNQPFGLPDAGLHAEQITASQRFGKAIAAGLAQDLEQGEAPLLTGLQACSADAALAASEAIGKRSFKIWSKILRTLGKPGTPVRRLGLCVYVTFLAAIICTIVPTLMLIRKIIFTLTPQRSAALRAKLELPSGNGDARMKDFV